MEIKKSQLFRLQKRYMTGLPFIIFILYGILALLPDLRLFIPEFLAVTAGITMLLAISFYLTQSGKISWSAGFILVFAAVFRIMFVFRIPELSDDIYRYMFDGLMLLSGHNPYAAAPADLLSRNLPVRGLVELVNHAELTTIYPPAAQFVFAAGAFLGGVFGMKLFLVLLDLLTCVLILQILAKLRLPRGNAVLYAWHPLPAVEIAASGHIDAAVLFFSFLAFTLLLSKNTNDRFAGESKKRLFPRMRSSVWQKCRGSVSGIIFAAAVLTKWFPLIFLPGVLILAPKNLRKYAGFGCLFGMAALIGVFWPDVKNGFHTLLIYTANWEFSGFAFRWMRHASGSGAITRLILAAVFIVSTAVIYFRIILMYRHNISSVSTPENNSDTSPLHKNNNLTYIHQMIFRGFYGIAMAFLLLTPTLHPWYALYLAAFLPFAAGPAGLTLSWSVFLAYHVMILYGATGQWVEENFVPLLIVSAPAGAAVIGQIWGKGLKLKKSDIYHIP